MRSQKKISWSFKLLNKTLIRKELLKKRSSIDALNRHHAAHAAVEILLHHPIFSNSHTVACYHAIGTEFNTTPLIQSIWHSQKECLLPVLSGLNENVLEFVFYRESDLLQYNRYRILEPTGGEKLSPDKIDLILLPLVGFDLAGNRLGMGGGFYDRTFQFMQGKLGPPPFLLGLGFEVQKVTEGFLPDVWDVKMNGVLTEKGLYLI